MPEYLNEIRERVRGAFKLLRGMKEVPETIEVLIFSEDANRLFTIFLNRDELFGFLLGTKQHQLAFKGNPNYDLSYDMVVDKEKLSENHS